MGETTRKKKKQYKKLLLYSKLHRIEYFSFVEGLVEMQRSFDRDKCLLDYLNDSINNPIPVHVDESITVETFNYWLKQMWEKH